LLNIILLFVSKLIDSILLLEDTVDVIVRNSIGGDSTFSPSFLLLGLLEVHEVLLVITLGLSAFQVISLRVSTSSWDGDMII
jgi:hypothetical protein